MRKGRRRRRGGYEDDDYDEDYGIDEGDDGDESGRSDPAARGRRGAARAPPRYYDRDDYYDDDDLRNDEDRFEHSSSKGGGGGYDDAPEWEACPTDGSGTAHVLLPPLQAPAAGGASSSGRLPTCVIHFVGGTFFGSTPTVWYGRLLREVSAHSSAAVVATGIPVSVLRSPLEHVRLAKKIERQFRAAYREILVDEYGEGIREVPVCGIGHSLGSRLLAVAATLRPPPAEQEEEDRHESGRASRHRGGGGSVAPPPPYRSMILMSFTNFGASAGIPGVGTLYKASRRVDRERRQEDAPGRRRQSRRDDRDDVGSFADSSDDEDDADDDGDDDSSLWDEITSAVKESARWVQSSLTPDAASLELHPSPAQLWKALASAADGGGGRYRVPRTLVVQFDRDRVDQSARLAETLRGSTDVRFARLRGTHLSPLSPPNPRQFATASSRTRRRPGRAAEATSEELDPIDDKVSVLSDLRQTIVRYTTEVVTKD
jgi:hypothetical protein